MDKQKKILNWLILIDTITTLGTMIMGLAMGLSYTNLLCLIPLTLNLFAYNFLKQNKIEISIKLALFSSLLSLYMVDSGFIYNTGTYLYYVPIIIAIYLFDSIGARNIIRFGLLSCLGIVILVNLNLSPKLLFEEMATDSNNKIVFYLNLVLSLSSSLLILQLFSNLRKEATQESEIRQANNLALLENSKDAVWSVDTDFKLVSFNSVYGNMFKGFWHRAPYSGASILFDPGKHKIYTDWNQWYKRAIAGEAFSFDIEYRFRDGIKTFEVSFTPIKRDQKIHGTVVKAIDVTQRKKAYIEQQLISENLDLLLSSTQEIIFEMDEKDLCKKVWKGPNVEMYFEGEVFIGKSVYQLFDAKFDTQMEPIFQQVKEDGLPREYEYSYKVKGENKHFIAKLRKIKNSNPPRVSIVIEEITARREAEILQKQQSDFLNKLIAHLPIGVFVKSVKQNLSYTLWNRELENMFQLSEGEVLGKSDAEVFKNAGEIEHYLATDNLVLQEKEPLLIQKLNIQVGDKQILARTFKIPLLDAEGNVESIIGLLENITDLVHSQQELENAEKRWNYALSGSRDAVWDVNLITDESFFSPMFNELLGYKGYESVPFKWEELVHPEDLPRAWNLFVDHLEGKSHFYECEYRLRKKDNSYIWILDRGKVAETDPDGNPTRIIGTFSNIDYRKKLEQEYKLALQKAEDASKAKSLFLSTMSHEIRTPMNGVIGIINLLQSENPKPEQVENIQALKYSADNLMFLLNDILDFSKIDAGKIDIEESSFNIYNTLQNTVKSFVNAAKEKGLELDLKASDNFPKALLGDQLRLNQIFNNLISNAIKFTPVGKISIAALTENLGSETIRIKFSFTDTGIGIDDEYMPHLFEHFTQASSDTTRKYGGSGLGLAICRSLVQAMGGELKAISKKDEGTQFSFSLEFKIDKKAPATSDAEKPNQIKEFPNMNVLLVEDNQMNVFVARKFLSKWKIEVSTATNGKEALLAVQKREFDLILMDLQMPEMDGFESASLMRKAGLNTPIFALSANVNMDAKQKVLECGMNEYISKPFNPDELFSKISMYYKPKNRPEKKPEPIGKLF